MHRHAMKKKIKGNFQHAGHCLNGNYRRERGKVEGRERGVNIDGGTSEERERQREREQLRETLGVWGVMGTELCSRHKADSSLSKEFLLTFLTQR